MLELDDVVMMVSGYFSDLDGQLGVVQSIDRINNVLWVVPLSQRWFGCGRGRAFNMVCVPAAHIVPIGYNVTSSWWRARQAQ